jgi:hypothetical protein
MDIFPCRWDISRALFEMALERWNEKVRPVFAGLFVEFCRNLCYN